MQSTPRQPARAADRRPSRADRLAPWLFAGLLIVAIFYVAPV